MLVLLHAFVFSSVFSQHTSPTAVRTVSGRFVPIEHIRKRVPNLSNHLLHTAVYEHINPEQLISHTHAINIHQLAPKITTAYLSNGIPVQVDDVEDKLDKFSTRKGSGFTFVYDDDEKTLLAAWGPGISLNPLNLNHYPRVFINTHARDPDSVSNAERHPLKVMSQQITSQSDITPITFRAPNNTAPTKRELELLVLHDAVFCRLFKTPSQGHKTVAALVKDMEPMFSRTGIKPVLTKMVGPCNLWKPSFQIPKEVEDCPLNSTTCSKPTLLLDSFRRHPGFQLRRRDLTLVFTGYDDGSSAIGAAYVGAACNVKFGWGWIQNTGFNDVVLAHELAHSLGALHDDEGIMKPSVDPNEKIAFSEKSVSLMNSFIAKAATNWCLRLVDGESSNFKVTVPQMILPEGMLAHDVSFGIPTNSSLINLYIALTMSSENGSDVLVAVAENVHIDNGGAYSVETWQGPFSIPGITTYKMGVVGVAFGHIRSSDSNDIVILYMKTRNVMEYVVGFGVAVIQSKLVVEEWSEAFVVPLGSSNLPVRTLGVTIGDVRQKGRNDLIIALVYNNNGGRYTIGWNMKPDGSITQGWSKQRSFLPPFSAVVTGISVALARGTENTLNLVFYSNEQSPGRLQRFFRVAKDIKFAGNAGKGWTTAIPAELAPIPATTGGLAVKLIPGLERLTTVVMQSALNPSNGSRGYLDFGFNLEAAILADSDGSIFESIVYGRSAGCLECYKGDEKELCTERLKICEASNSMVSNTRQTTGNNSSASFDDKRIYCNGFDSIFISPEGDTCDANSARDYVVSVGASNVLLDSLKNSLQNQPNSSGEILDVGVSIIYDTAPPDDGPDENGGNRPGAPNTVSIKFRSNRYIRKYLIQKAIQKLRRMTDYTASFKTASTWGYKRIGKNTFLVTLSFTNQFQDEFIENELWRPYGASYHTW